MSNCEALATKAEVAELRAEINKLKGNQIDINTLIQKAKDAVFSDQQWILALGAIAAFRNLDLSKYLTKQDPIVNKVEQARRIAESAYKNADNLHADLREAQNVAKTAKQQADAASGVANAAKQATNVLATDISRLGGALGVIGGIVNSILSILSVVGGAAGLIALLGTLYAIIPRLNAQEAYIDATAKTAADAYSLGLSNKMQLNAYKAKTDKRIADLERNVTDLTIQLRQAQNEIYRLEEELGKANANIKYLSSELTKAKAIIESLIKIIQQQQAVIESLQSQLTQLSATTDSRFKDLQAQADAIRKQAEAAIEQANRATAAANEALRRAGKADDTSRQTQQDINSGEVTKRWEPKVFEPIVTNVQARVDQQVKPIKVEMGNFERSQKELQANIEKEFGKLPNFEERLAKNEAEVKKQQGSLPTFNDLDSVNRSLNRNIDNSYKEIEKLKTQTQQIEQKQTQTSPTYVDQRFKDIEKVNAEANKKLDDIQKNFDKLPGMIGNIFKPQLDKLPQTVVETVTPALTANLAPALIQLAPQISDAVSQTITKEAPKIGDALKPVLDNLPLATALLVPGAIIASQPFISKMTDVAAAGTCRTTQPGGCMTRLGNDLTSSVNANTNNRFDTFGAANAVSNGAQTLLLRQVDAKLGAQIAGGLSGGLNRLGSFLGIDRIFNILNFLATTHNALMLTNGFKQTLLATLSSVGNATGLLETAEGGSIDLNKVANQGFEQLMIKLFGAEVWANIEVNWRKYNRIYQASANVMNAVSSMTNALGDAVETVAEHTGKVGNALKAAGQVRENAYQWFSEKVNAKNSKFMTYQSKIGEATAFLSVINEIAENVIEGQEGYTEAVKATEEFKKQIADAEKNTGIENKAIKEETERNKALSTQDPTGEDEKGLLSFLTDF